MRRPTARQICCVVFFIVAGLTPAAVQAQGTRLLRNPDVGPEHIVFCYANDLWLTSRDGGESIRLTSGAGNESDPAFSPDGKWIAFTGQYGGNSDVYVVSVNGGEPRRLTWHPGADVVQGWTNEGDILFQSGRAGQPTRLWQFYTVAVTGGLPKQLEVPQAFQGEMSADGKWLAYQEIGLWDPEWRNYRGGQAQPISIVSTETWERMTPPWEKERHLAPVWLDGVVYYLSERDWASNVWSFDPSSQVEKQHTFHVEFDAKSLGAGFGVVVYEQAGYLHELDPSTGQTRQLEIRVARDQNWARSRWDDVPGSAFRDARLSPTGKRALFEARGDLFTVPLEEGSWRNLTKSSGVADRHAVWSPDGQQIAWFNDTAGEYRLILGDQYGNIEREIEIPEPTFFFVPEWSPDGKRLAFTDTDYRVLVLELESGDLQHVATDRFAHPQRTMNPVWSPDSKWLAYAKRLENQLRVIEVCHVESGETHQITNGMADSASPVWDASGKYLYFIASTDFGLNTGWLDMTSYDRPVTRTLYMAILHSDEPSPFLIKSDEEETKDADEDSEGKEEAGEGDAQDTDEQQGGDDETQDEDDDAEDGEVVIDFDGISRRILAVPGIPQRDYAGLLPGPENSVFVFEGGTQGPTLHKYNVTEGEASEFLSGLSSATVSADRQKLLFSRGGSWSAVGTKGGSGAGAKPLAMNGIRVQIDPRAEWRQMLREGWRFMRDFLYVDNVHGADWDDVWAAYSPWLDDVNHRSDFNYLLDMLSGEVAVGHSYVRGGDMPDLTSPRTGMLGADLEEYEGFYRIAKIYDGGEWNPGTAGPLSAPGLEVAAGDYLLAIDGRELKSPTNPFELLEGTAGRTITITINSEPTLEDARSIAVRPISNEAQLRTSAWVEHNQKVVDEMSDGQLAYVWLPNTGRGGYTYFNRMYFAQQDRQGAVIDERNNGGGSAADYIIEVLDRELTGYFNSRAGDRRPFTQPMAGLFGPKVMVINERAGSGGDLLPYLFRFKEIGPLVGTRTWGGLVGTWDTPPLIDGGRFVAPRGGFFDVDGQWAVEAEGVAPDIEIRNDPKPVIEGRDPQLERAIAEALRLLETQRVELKPEPAPPVRARRPDRR